MSAVLYSHGISVNPRPGPGFYRGVAATVLLAAHVCIAWRLSREPTDPVTSGYPDGALLLISLPSQHNAIPASWPTLTLAPVPQLSVEPPPELLGESPPSRALSSGRTTPPHPLSLPDSHPFAKTARLSIASGATVVLRLEVLKSGAVGRVEVEVSGGSARIDRAAIAYVRATKWVSGRVDDRPETLWIRWGVRLDG